MTQEPIPEGTELCDPAPGSIIGSLRAIGYGFHDAVADIIDNSIAAHATQVEIERGLAHGEPFLIIRDNGDGMTEAELSTAMRIGSRSPKEKRLDPMDLGRFTLGLKTASFSQARILVVASKKRTGKWVYRCWDLDLVERENRWLLRKHVPGTLVDTVAKYATGTSGTIVLWSDIDRLGKQTRGQSRIAVLDAHLDALQESLGLTFHRFLAGDAAHLDIDIAGAPVDAKSPFLPGRDDIDIPRDRIRTSGTRGAVIAVCAHVLPPPHRLNEGQMRTLARGKTLATTQGFYVYRNKRLIVPGDWLTRKIKRDLAGQLARVQLDITSDMDEEWQIDVRKASAVIPVAVQERLIRVAKRAKEVSSASLNLRQAKAKNNEYPEIWQTTVLSDGRLSFKINKREPIVVKGLKDGLAADEVRALIRSIEEQLPFQKVHT